MCAVEVQRHKHPREIATLTFSRLIITFEIKVSSVNISMRQSWCWFNFKGHVYGDFLNLKATRGLSSGVLYQEGPDHFHSGHRLGVREAAGGAWGR